RSTGERRALSLEVGDVGEHDDLDRPAALRVVDDRGGDAHVDDAAVAADVALVPAEDRRTAGQQIAADGDVHRPVLGMGDVGQAHADELVPRVPGEVLVGGVDVDDDVVEGGRDGDRRGGAFEDGPRHRLPGREGGRHGALGRHVLE